MNDDKDALLTSLAHMQDRLWDVDSLNFERCTLHVPFAYIVWSSGGYEQVEKVPLGNAPADWLAEIASKSSQLGGNPSAVVMVGMGTMLALSGNARDAQTLMSISAGLMPTEVEGAESCLISHMKTAHQSEAMGRLDRCWTADLIHQSWKASNEPTKLCSSRSSRTLRG